MSSSAGGSGRTLTITRAALPQEIRWNHDAEFASAVCAHLPVIKRPKDHPKHVADVFEFVLKVVVPALPVL